jgi:hypothetical protein
MSRSPCDERSVDGPSQHRYLCHSGGSVKEMHSASRTEAETKTHWLDPQTRERLVEPNYYTASSSDQRLDHRLQDRKLETEDGSST